MEKSDKTISIRFLENLWPQILNQNECDAQNPNASEYFIPERKFDYKWAAELLADKCYKDYAATTELNDQPMTSNQTEGEVEQLPYREASSNILPLDQQLAIKQQDINIRKKLADDFVNRTFPWYIQRPSYPRDFQITDKVKEIFLDNFELEILQNMQRFRCNLIIIDVAVSVPLKNLETWLKFSSYASIVTVIHDGSLYELLVNSHDVFKPVWMHELMENSWQKELQRSIHTGLAKAKELFLLDDMNKPIVFVFSDNRGICVCNKFEILRKF